MIKSTLARRRSTRLSGLLLSCAATLVLVHQIPAQESPEPPRAQSEAGGRNAAVRLLREQAIERRKDFATMERIPALVRWNTLDKGAVAAAVHAGMKTLEELGRPHIPDGFLLKQAQRDPDRQVDTEQRNAYHARMVSTRGIGQSPREAHQELHGSRSNPVAEDSAPAGSSDSESTSWHTTALLMGVLFVLGFLLLRWRRGTRVE